MQVQAILTLWCYRTALASLAIVINGCGAAVEPDALIAEAVNLTPLTQNATPYDQTWVPQLYIESGCQPYAAVDALGKKNAGLVPSGSEDGVCSMIALGQTYARTRCWTNTGINLCASIYAWYFPKDVFMLGAVPITNAGHRHDWEATIIWTKDGEFAGAAFSQHGEWLRRDAGDSDLYLDDKSLRVKYGRTSGTHFVAPTDIVGSTHPLVSWGRLPSTLQTPLDAWIGDAIFPARNSNYATNMLQSVPDNLCPYFAGESPVCPL